LVKRTIRLIDSFIARASVLSTNQNATKQFFCLGGLGVLVENLMLTRPLMI
jgi:hypothetical protein